MVTIDDLEAQLRLFRERWPSWTVAEFTVDPDMARWVITTVGGWLGSEDHLQRPGACPLALAAYRLLAHDILFDPTQSARLALISPQLADLYRERDRLEAEWAELPPDRAETHPHVKKSLQRVNDRIDALDMHAKARRSHARGRPFGAMDRRPRKPTI
jgi:hypothetical protein